MTLYEIQSEIDELINRIFSESENGEIGSQASIELSLLQVQRDEKIANICKFVKNLRAESEACRSEAHVLTERARTSENRSKWLLCYLDSVLNGNKWSDGVSKVSYRKSQKVIVENINCIPRNFVKIEVTPKKSEIKRALEEGALKSGMHGVRIEESNNIQLK